MTFPCTKCGAARACEHRELDPPAPIPAEVRQTPKRYEPREDGRKTRDYTGQGFNFRASTKHKRR